MLDVRIGDYSPVEKSLDVEFMTVKPTSASSDNEHRLHASKTGMDVQMPQPGRQSAYRPRRGDSKPGGSISGLRAGQRIRRHCGIGELDDLQRADE